MSMSWLSANLARRLVLRYPIYCFRSTAVMQLTVAVAMVRPNWTAAKVANKGESFGVRAFAKATDAANMAITKVAITE